MSHLVSSRYITHCVTIMAHGLHFLLVRAHTMSDNTFKWGPNTVTPTEEMKEWVQHVLECKECQNELLKITDNTAFLWNCMFNVKPCQKWKTTKTK